ncbi:hypothetical protein QAD02_004687 [Eretmocerus hayati]|uniref:Uncharacterized protein n=1 Tax=Eretmocerus hayati TaxID=131215 RepID=A0ACC2NV28_9HYME|nr:hypothetical protein QAD02_004687 [Eretmocerus hayati]
MKATDCEGQIKKLKQPLRLDSLDDGLRPRDWQPKRARCKVPLRLARLFFLGILLPALFIAGPVYMRYRVFSEQLYPLAISDQRLIDGRISTTWCQRQVVKVNATFNAYLMNGIPRVQVKAMPVSMTRHLVLEDDMKEYWGFYLLRGSTVTVSTCVRWPGASLAVIRGHKNLHECAFIGDDSSEELEELLEIVEKEGILSKPIQTNTNASGLSNGPSKMKKVKQTVQFHHSEREKDNLLQHNNHQQHHEYSSHELDAKDMRDILTQLFTKTLDMRKRQKDTKTPQNTHYEGTFKESDNIDKPPSFDDSEFMRHELESLKALAFGKLSTPATDTRTKLQNSRSVGSTPNHDVNTKLRKINGTRAEVSKLNLTSNPGQVSPPSQLFPNLNETSSSVQVLPEKNKTQNVLLSSAEEFREAIQKIGSVGSRGRKFLSKLIKEIDHQDSELEEVVKKALSDLSVEEKERIKREIVLSSPIGSELMKDDEDDDAAIEEGLLHPDGIAEDHLAINETTMNDRSNSEFWSSFSSSEERLLDCKGLILNLPLMPHHRCERRLEKHHTEASVANTITYRVPTDGYYFFVFSSENEIQTNYLRVKFNLLKTVYDTSDPVFECKNSTGECSLPMKFFSSERTVLELPVSGNDSQWNNEYVVISTCEPRTAIYLVCTMAVPLLILMFAFY